jgi:hypothetical protein
MASFRWPALVAVFAGVSMYAMTTSGLESTGTPFGVVQLGSPSLEKPRLSSNGCVAHGA